VKDQDRIHVLGVLVRNYGRVVCTPVRSLEGRMQVQRNIQGEVCVKGVERMGWALVWVREPAGGRQGQPRV